VDCDELKRRGGVEANTASDTSNMLQKMEEEVAKMREEMKADVQGQKEALGQLQESLGVSGKDGQLSVVDRMEDLEKQMEALRQSGAGSGSTTATTDHDLWPRIESTVECAVAPLGAAIEALEAKIECQLLVRLENCQDRITQCEREQQSLFTSREEFSMSQESSRDISMMESAAQIEERLAALGAVKEEIGSLASQLNGVVASVGALECELQAKGGGAEFAEDLSRVSKILENRMVSIETKIDEAGDGKDITEVCETLRNVEGEMRALGAKTSLEMQPKIESQAEEVLRLRRELTLLMDRMNDLGDSANSCSMATAQGSPHCLVCYKGRNQSSNKIIVGRDGKTYLQGNSDKVAMHQGLGSGGMVRGLLRSRGMGGRCDQGGAGAPLRKYKIPMGADGVPTWGMVKGLGRSATTGALERPPISGGGMSMATRSNLQTPPMNVQL